MKPGLGSLSFDPKLMSNPERTNPDPAHRERSAEALEQTLKELADIREANGASFIYREDNARYIGVQYSIKNRDLASAVEDAQRQVAKQITVPPGASCARRGTSAGSCEKSQSISSTSSRRKRSAAIWAARC